MADPKKPTEPTPALKVEITAPQPPKSPPEPPPTAPAREGVDRVAQLAADRREAEAAARETHVTVTSPSAERRALNDADVPNVVVSGHAVPRTVGVAPNPAAVRGGRTLAVQMLVPYASAQTVLLAGKAYNLSEEFARTLLECDPPAATQTIDEANKRLLRPPTPDPEDKSNQ